MIRSSGLSLTAAKATTFARNTDSMNGRAALTSRIGQQRQAEANEPPTGGFETSCPAGHRVSELKEESSGEWRS
jgi:hypothetical protein